MPERVSPVWVASAASPGPPEQRPRDRETVWDPAHDAVAPQDQKPYWSAPVAEDDALVTICSVVCPPGGTVTAPGTEIVTPGVDACGWTVTDHAAPARR